MAQRPDDKPDRPDEDANSQQVRADIDAGRTRDKVDHPDPATAPLGTDAEAGGAPASPPESRLPRDDAARHGRPVHGPEPRSAARPWLISLVVAIVVLVGLAWYFAAL